MISFLGNDLMMAKSNGILMFSRSHRNFTDLFPPGSLDKMSSLITKESSNFVLRVMHLDSTHAVIDAILTPTGAYELCRKIAEKQDNLKD
jgi:hypothetical protein